MWDGGGVGGGRKKEISDESERSERKELETEKESIKEMKGR